MLVGAEAAGPIPQALLESWQDQAGRYLRARILARQHSQHALKALNGCSAFLELLLSGLQMLLHAGKQVLLLLL